MDISNVHAAFSEKLRVRGGGAIRGQIAGFSETARSDGIPDRLLKVSKRSTASAGQVVITSDGVTYLLAQHHTSHSAGAMFRTFRMIRVDEELDWSRTGSILDPVTGMSRSSGGVQSLGTVLAAVDPMKLEGEARMKPESRVRIMVGDDVQIGDQLGDYQVLFVDNSMGIKIVEAR